MVADPRELRDLSREQKALAARFRGEIRLWRQKWVRPFADGDTKHGAASR